MPQGLNIWQKFLPNYQRQTDTFIGTKLAAMVSINKKPSFMERMQDFIENKKASERKTALIEFQRNKRLEVAEQIAVQNQQIEYSAAQAQEAVESEKGKKVLIYGAAALLLVYLLNKKRK